MTTETLLKRECIVSIYRRSLSWVSGGGWGGGGPVSALWSTAPPDRLTTPFPSKDTSPPFLPGHLAHLGAGREDVGGAGKFTDSVSLFSGLGLVYLQGLPTYTL